MQNAEITWEVDGRPIAARFDDPYFSHGDGAAETQHVFLAGNDLPARFAPGFHIAELGFGTGLNALVAGAVWNASGRLRYTGFEAYPMRPDDAARALARWEFPDQPAMLDAINHGLKSFQTPNLDVELIIGDARQTLAHTNLRADAWFLDGFSPAKNPELWGEDLMREVARHTAPGGTFATYAAAGHVRRALATAGFVVERCAGFGTKNHMSRGKLGPMNAE